ncbi:MAG: HD-GYP domain-containing protein [Actinomycetota bacterium]|nr:HD-GYP domain-containing protein [Actinomycetota bacterium]
MWIYGATLATAALATAGALWMSGAQVGPPLVVVGLAAAAAFAERGSVRLSSTIDESISALPMLFAAVLFGPFAAMVVAAASMLGDFTRPYLRWGIYTSSRAITAAIVGIVATTTGDTIQNRSVALAASTIVAAIVAQALDCVFASATVYLRKSGGVAETARLLLPVAAAAIPLYAPLVALLAIAYDQVSAWATMLFFVPALAAQRLYTLYQEQRRLTDGLTQANEKLERANLSFAAALVATLDARDRYTAGHSAAVAVYSRDIARRMGLDEAKQQIVHLAGLVHDIGKIGLPPGLLEKAGPLTLDERRAMQTHSEIGERILANVDTYGEIAEIVRSHHERVDGNGYPDGIADEKIPLLARIVAVADAYNAMTSDRPYREAMPSRVARLRLAQAVGSQFDTSVVAAFEAILATADERYRLGQRDEFEWTTTQPLADVSVMVGVA